MKGKRMVKELSGLKKLVTNTTEVIYINLFKRRYTRYNPKEMKPNLYIFWISKLKIENLSDDVCLAG